MVNGQTPWVVLDSTVLNMRDWYLEQMPARLLLRECRQHRLRLAVPEVVMVECTAAHKREATTAFHKMIDLHGTLSSLRARPAPVASPRIAYRPELEGILKEAYATILPLPKVAHTFVLERAVNRQKPFDSKDSGYRDTLVWYSVLELVQRGDGPIALISGDRNAFADKNAGDIPKLHADLVADLEKVGHSDAVSLFFGLPEYVGSLGLPPDAEVLAHWEHRLSRESEFRVSLLTAIEQAVLDPDAFWLATVGTDDDGYPERLWISDARYPRVQTAMGDGASTSVQMVVYVDYVLAGVSLPLDQSGRRSPVGARSIEHDGTAEVTVEVSEDPAAQDGLKISLLDVSVATDLGDDTDLPGFEGWTNQGTPIQEF